MALGMQSVETNGGTTVRIFLGGTDCVNLYSFINREEFWSLHFLHESKIALFEKINVSNNYGTSSNTEAPQLFVVLDLLRFAHLELPERIVSEYIRTSTLSIPWNNIHIAVAPSAVFTSGNPPISANPPLPTFAIDLPGRDHSSR